MLNKLKKILQWFVSVCFILSGLIYVGEYTVLAIVLMVNLLNLNEMDHLRSERGSHQITLCISSVNLGILPV